MKPEHYAPQGAAGLDCMDAVDAVAAGKEGLQAFFVGNIVKYLYRYPHKGQALADLDKAADYLSRLREIVEAEQPKKSSCQGMLDSSLARAGGMSKQDEQGSQMEAE